jgi:hypothetical protein
MKVMGMPLELNTMIVTKNNEEKTVVENIYTLTKEGYRLYPVDIPIVEVRTTKSASPYALAKINRLSWENGQTQITYELVELMGVN